MGQSDRVMLGDRLLYFAQSLLRGDDVADLHRKLTVLGYVIEDEEGVFGTSTERAVILFQRKAGLVPDGIVGPKTLRRL
jgi:peptidoglycan hydrolase-like protein with peptidoglycan-binding domain